MTLALAYWWLGAATALGLFGARQHQVFFLGLSIWCMVAYAFERGWL